MTTPNTPSDAAVAQAFRESTGSYNWSLYSGTDLHNWIAERAAQLHANATTERKVIHWDMDGPNKWEAETTSSVAAAPVVNPKDQSPSEGVVNTAAPHAANNAPTPGFATTVGPAPTNEGNGGGVTADCMDALRSYQQADMDGVMVRVSRQALDEAIAALSERTKGEAVADAEAWKLIWQKPNGGAHKSFVTDRKDVAQLLHDYFTTLGDKCQLIPLNRNNPPASDVRGDWVVVGETFGGSAYLNADGLFLPDGTKLYAAAPKPEGAS